MLNTTENHTHLVKAKK